MSPQHPGEQPSASSPQSGQRHQAAHVAPAQAPHVSDAYDRAPHAQDPRGPGWRQNVSGFFGGYFWFIFKNVIGWIFILASPVLGITIPGPGGIPIFLIGFALVTLPGKRKLTSRVMRGRGLPLEMQVFTFLTALAAIVATCIVMWIVSSKVLYLLSTLNLDPNKQDATITAIIAGLLITGLLTMGITWLVMRLALQVLNYVLKGMPILRRKVRPWLRKHGLILLPSRRKRLRAIAGNGQAEQLVQQQPAAMDDEILQIHERHHERLRAIGMGLLLWAKRAIGVGITVAIFAWILKPIVQQWPQVKDRILELSPLRFALAAGMFAIFLFVFRALVWRMIVRSFGHKLPVAAATRIWSTSELARYLPGVIWQVVGRVYLVRPYGVSGSVCGITQILELAIFLLANIFVALACLLYFGIKNLDGAARGWLYVAAALVPALLLLLHTRVFYGIVNGIMQRLGKPRIVQRLRGYMLVGLLFWNVLGLLWQSLAIFIIVQQPLALKWDWWWVVAGAYCLAWVAGFLAFWAPGGIGVREIVFIGAMRVILPQSILNSTQGLEGLLGLLAVLLRLWATAGELIVASVAYGLDLRGALGYPDAPGRVALHPASQTQHDVKVGA